MGRELRAQELVFMVRRNGSTFTAAHRERVAGRQRRRGGFRSSPRPVAIGAVQGICLDATEEWHHHRCDQIGLFSSIF